MSIGSNSSTTTKASKSLQFEWTSAREGPGPNTTHAKTHSHCMWLFLPHMHTRGLPFSHTRPSWFYLFPTHNNHCGLHFPQHKNLCGFTLSTTHKNHCGLPFPQPHQRAQPEQDPHSLCLFFFTHTRHLICLTWFISFTITRPPQSKWMCYTDMTHVTRFIFFTNTRTHTIKVYVLTETSSVSCGLFFLPQPTLN